MRTKLMKSMWNHSQSWPFKEPVDHVKLNIPTYPEIVRAPMDLLTVKTKLLNGGYGRLRFILLLLWPYIIIIFLDRFLTFSHVFSALPPLTRRVMWSALHPC